MKITAKEAREYSKESDLYLKKMKEIYEGIGNHASKGYYIFSYDFNIYEISNLDMISKIEQELLKDGYEVDSNNDNKKIGLFTIKISWFG